MFRFYNRTQTMHWIRLHMQTFNITQKELSKRTGIDRSNLSNILKGKKDCTLDTLHNILSNL